MDNRGAKRQKTKKPIYKRWWLWVIVGIILFAIIGSSGESGESDNASLNTDQRVISEAQDTAVPESLSPSNSDDSVPNADDTGNSGLTEAEYPSDETAANAIEADTPADNEHEIISLDLPKEEDTASVAERTIPSETAQTPELPTEPEQEQEQDVEPEQKQEPEQEYDPEPALIWEYYPADTIVYVSNSGKKIHSVNNCSGMKNYTEMTLGQAVDRGYKQCSNCW